MTIKVKFFARMRDEAGLSSGEVEFRPGMKSTDVWSELVKDVAYPDSVMVALNMEYVSGDPEVEDGDEIAFFPPVTGG